MEVNRFDTNNAMLAVSVDDLAHSHSHRGDYGDEDYNNDDDDNDDNEYDRKESHY